MQYPSMEVLQKNIGEANVNATLDHCSIAVKDILIFAPALASNLKGYSNAVINVNAEANGFVKDITIPTLEVNGIGNTSLNVKGNIKGLPDAMKAYYDLQLLRFATSKKDIMVFVPAKSLPSSVRIPTMAEANGYFKGRTNKFSAKANIKTSNGSVDVVGSADLDRKLYDAKATLRNADLGYILKQDSLLGKISAEANIKGSGFDYKKMNTVANVHFTYAVIKDYHYKDLVIDASIKDDSAIIQSSIHDPNISYTLNAKANLQNKYPAIKLLLEADTLDLLALHWVKDTMNVSGIVEADFTNTNPDTLEGTLKLYQTAVHYNGKNIKTDTLSVTAERTDNLKERISVNAEMAQIKLEGNYKLTEIGTALQHTLNQYYQIPGFKDTAFTPQEWEMQMLLTTSPLVLQFVPELKGTDTIGANAYYNSSANQLNMQLSSPLIQYGEQKIENLDLNVFTADSALQYKFLVSKAGTESLQLYQTSLSGYAADTLITTSLLLKDKSNKDRYHIAGRLRQLAGGLRFSLLPDSLLLNYDNWQVNENNFIEYDSSGIIAKDFRISNNEQALQINSQSLSAQAPLEVSFSNFHIKTLTDFADQDSLLLDGVIDGTAIVKNATTNPIFTSDLLIKDLSYKKDTIGNITVVADNETANAYNTNIKIEGNGNDLQLSGKYYTGESRMDLKLNIANINLAAIPPLSAGQIKEAGGSLKGAVDITGTLDKPQPKGDIRFENAFLTPSFLNTRFSLKDEKIDISEKGVSFNEFTLTDSADNKAVINGNINTQDYKSFSFDLTADADDFIVVNAAKTNNASIYGKMIVDAQVKVGGDMNLPAINAKVNVNKGTNVTYVLPSENPEVQSREGVVNFVDFAHPDTTAIAFADSVKAAAAVTGINLDAIIETDTAAQFTLVIDELTGDALEVKGNASLAAGMDESGKLSLTGNYELQSGSYQLSFNFLKRKFLIQKGSVLTWTGDPMSANVDITALYEIKAAPIDLVESELAGLSTTELNRYKQRIPVQVFLKMQGELLKPQISFEISLPKDEESKWPVVKNKLSGITADESELNKQVFALLLLNRFVGEDLLQSQAGSTSTETRIRQSVSGILTDQLNKLAANLIRGVDLSFGINSEDDYTTGTQQTRTDLSVGVSKSLLNDRVKVTVGSNFELEGPAGSNQPASNIAGDIIVDYQLSKDGRYMLRAYRKNKYEAVVEGHVIESGLTFILTFDYDYFRELFQKRKTEKKSKKNK